MAFGGVNGLYEHQFHAISVEWFLRPLDITRHKNPRGLWLARSAGSYKKRDYQHTKPHKVEFLYSQVHLYPVDIGTA